MTDTQNTPKRPIDKHRDGALEVAIWKQESDKGPFYTSERTRAYQDNNGDWQKSHSIPERDLLRAARLDQKAYESIQKMRDQDRAQYIEHQKQPNTQPRDQDRNR
ncbi:hypothetical protein [Pacificibacter sp. AS14]|uniref:hypothetical protein n=1 Tax=Pacificibacter sp. AS14 TaxID=3135785 RepID=UPI00317F7000